MRIIYKAPLLALKRQSVLMPVDAFIIAVDFDPRTHDPALWYMTDPNTTDMQPRWFHVIATGVPFEFDVRDFVHLGTVSIPDMPFVWHVFENLRAGDAMHPEN